MQRRQCLISGPRVVMVRGVSVSLGHHLPPPHSNSTQAKTQDECRMCIQARAKN